MACKLVRHLCTYLWPVLLLSLTPHGSVQAETETGQTFIGYVADGPSDFWTFAYPGIEQWNRQHPAHHVEFNIPFPATVEQQLALVEELVERGADGVIVNLIHPVASIRALKLLQPKTAIMTVNRDAPASGRVCHLGIDYTTAGIQAATLIRQSMPDGGQILPLAADAHIPEIQALLKGIQLGLADLPHTVASALEDRFDKEKAAELLQTALAAPTADICLVGTEVYHSPLLRQAVQSPEASVRITAVCFDSQAGTLAAIQQEHFSGAVIQEPEATGLLPLNTMKAYLQGDQKAVPADRRIVFPTRMITPSSARDYKRHLAELLR